MAEATLRGHVEIEPESAKALAKAGWPVEVRYFVRKANCKAPTKEPAAPRQVKPNTRNNFIGIGETSHEGLSGDRLRVAVSAQDAITKQPHKIARRVKLLTYTSAKLKLTRQQAASQLTHLIRMGVLKDMGQFPPGWQKTNGGSKS